MEHAAQAGPTIGSLVPGSAASATGRTSTSRTTRTTSTTSTTGPTGTTGTTGSTLWLGCLSREYDVFALNILNILMND
jgi:hypothetical protein